MQNVKMNRVPAISLSRILGMTFIILCHIVGYYTFIPMYHSLGQFFNCGVVLFLFISGYLYGGKTIRNFKQWYVKRILTISLPSVLISIAVIIVLSVIGTPTSINSIIAYCLDLEGLLFLSWKAFSGFFSEIPGLGPLWFTTIIMICYLLIPVLQIISEKFSITSGHLIMLFIIGAGISIAVSPYCSITNFLFFILGYFSKKTNLLERMDQKFFILHSVVFVAAVIGRLVLQKTIDGTFVYLSYSTISHFFVGTWFVSLFSYLYNIHPTAISAIADARIVKTLDKYSFYVYLTHGIFCSGTFNLFKKLPLTPATILFFICTISTALILKYISDFIRGLIPA